jgi:hypothetical protein
MSFRSDSSVRCRNRLKFIPQTDIYSQLGCCLVQCSSDGGTRTTGDARTVAWWCVKKFGNYFFKYLKFRNFNCGIRIVLNVLKRRGKHV